jgi:hypothetical protein
VTVVEWVGDEFVAKSLEFACSLTRLQVGRDDGNTRRVVSAVLQAPEPSEKDLLRTTRTHVTDDAAHRGKSIHPASGVSLRQWVTVLTV